MKKLYILAAVFALITGALFYGYLSRLGQETTVERDSVVVAARNIGAMETITPDMLKVVEVEKGTAHPASVSDPATVTGKITESEILEGEPVYPQKLKESGSLASGLAYTVPSGSRALTIAVDQVSGLSGYLQPGDVVDLIATVTLTKMEPGNTEKSAATSGILARNLTVLACGLKQTAEGEALTYETLTLAVTPGQAVEITQAATQGMVRAMLHNPQDSTAATAPTETNETLFDEP